MSTNDITGDKLISNVQTSAYDEGYDRIFGKKKKLPKTLGEMIKNESEDKELAIKVESPLENTGE